MKRTRKLLEIPLGYLTIPVYEVEGLQEDEEAVGRFTHADGPAHGYVIEIDAQIVRTGGGAYFDVLIHECLEACNELYELGLSHSAIQTLGFSLGQSLQGLLEEPNEKCAHVFVGGGNAQLTTPCLRCGAERTPENADGGEL